MPDLAAVKIVGGVKTILFRVVEHINWNEIYFIGATTGWAGQSPALV